MVTIEIDLCDAEELKNHYYKTFRNEYGHAIHKKMREAEAKAERHRAKEVLKEVLGEMDVKPNPKPPTVEMNFDIAYALLWDMWASLDYKLWNNDVGNERQQKIFDELHSGKYGFMHGAMVQFKQAIEYFKSLPKEQDKQTVEISLEEIKYYIKHCEYNIPTGLLEILKEAISKAEGKDPVNGPALPIQDQVNELRKEVSDLKDTISQLQLVIEGMKGK